MQPIDLIEKIIKIAELAGTAIMTVYQQASAIETMEKADQSPLTEADLQAHTIIFRHLQRLTPDIPVLSEEAADIDYTLRSSWQRYWLVDPLDGTKEFIKRRDQFTVNIALIDGHQPILSVVYAPALNVLYWAEPTLGSHKIDENGQATAIQVRKIPEQTPIMVVASRNHQHPQLVSILSNLGNHKLISMGSSLKFCLVAEGKADLYPRLGPTCEWDTAAAQCIVEVAGGQVVDPHGQPLRYNEKQSLLNPAFLAMGDGENPWLATWLS